MASLPDLETLKSGDKPAVAAALAAIERSVDGANVLALLDAAWRAPRAHVVGMTGPPGVGKSTLMSALIEKWRAAGRRVGVIAVDPSSRRTGGALLGDRTRLVTDPDDEGVFIRSMAARDRLGGLAALTISSTVLMRAIYDIVLVETVGVGQSETDIVTLADTVVFCVQPGSGDSLQFMKSGIMEVPHLVAVTKADMGAAAQRACSDVRGALSLSGHLADGWVVPVLMVSAEKGEGVDELISEIDRHAAWLAEDGRRDRTRAAQAQSWLEQWIGERFGREGLKRAGDRLRLAAGQSPFSRESEIAAQLLKSVNAG